MNDVSKRFIFRVGSATNILGRPPYFYRSTDLVKAGARFSSVYAIREEDARAIQKEAGTAAGFRGLVWSQRLWVDFDQEEPAQAAIKYLRKENYDFVVYSTGNRGCHIGIARDCNPSHTLPFQDKAWVKEHLPGADLSLYWHLHLIRLPGAIHERTGKPKRLIETNEGRAVILPPYAEEVRESSDIASVNDDRRPALFTLWSVVSNLTGEGDSGDRHKQLLNLAIALKKDAGLKPDQALWIMMEVNRGFSMPKNLTEVENIVKWTYEEAA